MGYYYSLIADLDARLAELELRLLEVKTSEKVPADETAGWKTYRNEKYGYEISYPDGWLVYAPVSDSDNVQIYHKVSEYTADGSINILPIGGYGHGFESPVPWQKKKIIIGGLEAMESYYNYEGSYVHYIKIEGVNSPWTDSNRIEMSYAEPEVSYKILSTFKFLD